MQDRPTAWELLDAVAELLEETLMPATEGGVRHQARVAANLCRIVQRELETGARTDRREVELLSALLGMERDGDGLVEAESLELSHELRRRLLGGDEALEVAAWPALLEIVRAKLAIAKPGYDRYDYSGEDDP